MTSSQSARVRATDAPLSELQEGNRRHGLWRRFAAANRRITHDYLQPRLYAVGHMTALEWWFGHHVPRLPIRDALLEFGCGETFPLSRLLGRHFQTCCACDIENVTPALWPEGVVFRRSDAEQIPFEDARFDVVVIRSVLEHLEKPEAIFGEISRVLKPGGRVFLNLPNKWDYVSVLARLTGRFKSRMLHGLTGAEWTDFPVFYRCNTRRAFTRALAATGLRIEVFRPLPSEPAYLKWFVPFYIAGAVYQFLISLLCLDVLQPSFIAVLRKESA